MREETKLRRRIEKYRAEGKGHDGSFLRGTDKVMCIISLNGASTGGNLSGNGETKVGILRVD